MSGKTWSLEVWQKTTVLTDITSRRNIRTITSYYQFHYYFHLSAVFSNSESYLYIHIFFFRRTEWLLIVDKVLLHSSSYNKASISHSILNCLINITIPRRPAFSWRILPHLFLNSLNVPSKAAMMPC